jgi:hypothetical protein
MIKKYKESIYEIEEFLNIEQQQRLLEIIYNSDASD